MSKREVAKNNPYDDPYRRQLTGEHLDNLIDHSHEPFYHEKKVYYSRMGRTYMDQIKARVDERAARMPDMVQSRRWKQKTLAQLTKFSAPVPGYDYNERTGSLITTANHRPFRMSRSVDFSCTLETTSKLKRQLGYATVAIIAGFAIYGGWLLRNAINEAGEFFLTQKIGLEQLLDSNTP